MRREEEEKAKKAMGELPVPLLSGVEGMNRIAKDTYASFQTSVKRNLIVSYWYFQLISSAGGWMTKDARNLQFSAKMYPDSVGLDDALREQPAYGFRLEDRLVWLKCEDFR